MTNRREFIKAGSALAALSLISCEEQEKYVQNTNSKAQLPISIATWGPNEAAVNAAMAEIESGKTALDAVEAGAKVPEGDPKDMSVGYGGRPDRDGKVTLDACIMDWEMNAGSVSFVQGIKHPISVARKVMEKTPHVMLAGEGAQKFAIEEGFEVENILTEEAEKAYQEWLKTAEYRPQANIERHDTIGIMAIDQNSKIAGACTTSGMAFKMHGRVGDSPVIGAGMYVDDEVGGAVATGVGELVLKTCGSFLIVELMRQGKSPQEACEEGVKRIAAKVKNFEESQVGFLAINKEGHHGAFAILKGFNYAINQGGETKVYESDYLVKS
ncbi:N(4)-(beta-N-acetylglucosaminyl)-L-asparaginase [Jiulongibacter sediminis]|jgi:N4-(beta-N-acetylglucosaminyl)-L-asparaginase|uniref:N(4)-(beta-N-acetylglucosaminyl)-L-asparaginase n=1 Tax=Jiulongibacter sediminis TaxID=1605367 RepID=UPI0026F280DE|nr:N(4)-(beta-N-acetylglucosaminyl)-L-asparaginase [Jiulongibacter sediminis]